MKQKKLITNSEVFSIALNRKVDEALIKDTQVLVAQSMYIHDYIGSALYRKILDNENNVYDDFTNDYIKPIIAWGTILNNYDYITVNITDKGVVLLLSEGGANVTSDSIRMDSKMEIRSTLYRLIKIMLNEISENITDDLFRDYIDTGKPYSLVTFTGDRKRNNITA